MTDAQGQVQQMLDSLVANGTELGLQAAAYLNGKLVIDAWAGLADEATGRPVDGDTLFTVFSASKGITATCIHIAAERGLLDYDTPIAHYWPEFAAHRKERATVRHALAHQVGIPQMPEGVTPEMICDWDTMCAAIADLTPLWEPGTKAGYHALTYGWILGEVLRRADGRPIAQFLNDEIGGPLGIGDMFFGITDEVEPRVAILKDAQQREGLGSAAVWNRPDIRRAVIPAGGGIMNARALARHYAALAQGGEIDGVRLLTPERLRIATRLETDASDQVLGPGYPTPVRRALGYQLGGPRHPATAYQTASGQRLTSFGHPGAGGTMAFADPEIGFAFAMTKNLTRVSVPGVPDAAVLVAEATRRALGIAE
ncbi:MAG: serine hydrolase [Chloroflexi bacterium]|nr:serine hydrolase [Chloroflexota bacterium]